MMGEGNEMNKVRGSKGKRVTDGFKVDEDLMDVINELIEVSDMQKDERFAQEYQVKRRKDMKDIQEEYITEIDEVKYHTHCLLELFKGMVIQTVHMKESTIIELESEIKQYKELLFEARTELRTCKENLSCLNNETHQIRKEKDELLAIHEEMKSTFDHAQDSIIELKNQVEEQKAEIVTLESTAKEKRELNTRLNDTLLVLDGLNDRMEELESEFTTQTQEFEVKEKALLEEYNTKLLIQEKHYNKEIEHLKAYYEQQIQQLNDYIHIEKEKILLEQDKRHQAEWKKIQDDLNKNIQALYKKEGMDVQETEKLDENVVSDEEK
jgi:hypothetical protein